MRRESLIRIDADFPLEKAALFGCAVLTGVGAVINTAKIEPGTSVAVFGLGGVGHHAVMGARLAGAFPIIGVDVLDAKLELARDLGATHTVNSRTQKAVEAIKEITQGGVACALEAVGSDVVLASAYAAMRRGGKTVAIGLAHPSQSFSVAAASLVTEERTVMGSYMGSAVPYARCTPLHGALPRSSFRWTACFPKPFELTRLTRPWMPSIAAKSCGNWCRSDSSQQGAAKCKVNC